MNWKRYWPLKRNNKKKRENSQWTKYVSVVCIEVRVRALKILKAIIPEKEKKRVVLMTCCIMRDRMDIFLFLSLVRAYMHFYSTTSFGSTSTYIRFIAHWTSFGSRWSRRIQWQWKWWSLVFTSINSFLSMFFQLKKKRKNNDMFDVH